MLYRCFFCKNYTNRDTSPCEKIQSFNCHTWNSYGKDEALNGQNLNTQKRFIE